MIRLLKYDWKRNSNSLVAATAILILVQIAIGIVGRMNDWEPLMAYILSIVIYSFAGFMMFLMVCQTYNANLKAHSRRLLPIPSLYAVASPILLLLAGMAVLLILFLWHEFVYVTWLGLDETVLSTVREKLSFGLVLSFLLGCAWMAVVITIFVMFCITFARTFEGKLGTWLGIAMFIGLSIVTSWFDANVIPAPAGGDVPFGITGISLTESSPDGLGLSVTGLEGVGFVSVLFELGFAIALLYGIRYMIHRRIKI
ncbi:MAG: hypothetical protein K0Q63_2723 [Paenibacillus sp.]|nr:hypothetical protein [Paenibacillus sp.]